MPRSVEPTGAQNPRFARNDGSGNRAVGRSGEWRDKGEERFLASLGMTVRETERWGEVASGEWRDKGEERFLASLGMTVSFARLKGNEWPIEKGRPERRNPENAGKIAED